MSAKPTLCPHNYGCNYMRDLVRNYDANYYKGTLKIPPVLPGGFFNANAMR